MLLPASKVSFFSQISKMSLLFGYLDNLMTNQSAAHFHYQIFQLLFPIHMEQT